MTYKAEIWKALGKLGKNGTENPDAKHNAGALLGTAYMWDEVERFAKARSDEAWGTMAKEGLIPADKKTLDPGDHELAYSPTFYATAKVTQPVRRFNLDELAKLLSKSKYKVPDSVTKELADQAKIPTSSIVTMRIIERG